NLGWRAPGWNGEDTYKLEVLDGILSNGFSSRLFQRLRDERGIGYTNGSFFDSFGDEGFFLIYADGFDPKRFEEAKEVILNELEDLKVNLVTDRELRKTKNLLISQYSDSLESLEFRANNILVRELDNEPYDFRKTSDYVEEITKEDVRYAAQRYLTDQYTLTALVPEGFKV
ncbi:insulinase family protein, partial [Patescibacteria group bacterium AH-259-L07]|nr:insulinase family protein [Patescibacteria group bacterium AH-259-L07]